MNSPTTMTAAVYRRFGEPEAVRVEQVTKPSPRRDEVLLRIHASTVSAADHRARSRTVPRGLGVLAALGLGVFRPRIHVLGMDGAGVIESVGADVTAFKPGDEVIAMLGAKFGAHAEYVCLPQGGPIAKKPRNMTFEQAVTLVFGGATALGFLGRAAVKPGDRVLVNGASGAVGTATVQLARQMGAHVTAVCSEANRELVTALGADRVIDYATADFASGEETYDVIVDCVGNAPFERVEAVINPGGSLLLVISDLKGILLAGLRSRRSGKLVTAGNVNYNAADLALLVYLAETSELQAVTDRTFDLSDIVDAHRYVDTGRKRGSVVVRVAPASASLNHHPGR